MRRLAALPALALLAIGLAGCIPGTAWYFENLDGPGVSGGNGRTANATGMPNAAILYGGVEHVFSFDRTAPNPLGEHLRHAWWTGTAWSFESLDGYQVTGGNGRTNAAVGSDVAAVAIGSSIHVFYYEVVAGRLRHAYYSPATGWFFENLDGTGVAGGNGRVNQFLGDFASTLAYGSVPHVFYMEFNSGGSQRLRHGWWTGSAWKFETLDGTTGIATGQTNDNVGFHNSSALIAGLPHVFHRDNTTASLRHAWYSPGVGWSAETVDGDGGGGGRTNDEVGDYSAIIDYSGAHVWYYDTTTTVLRHAWYAGGWHFEKLDGPGASGWPGQTTQPVGQYNAVVLYGGTPHVFSYSPVSLRHAWWAGAVWSFEWLDGPDSTKSGHTNSAVGHDNAALVGPTKLHVFTQVAGGIQRDVYYM